MTLAKIIDAVRRQFVPRRLAGTLFALLVMFAPSGTRWIYRTGEILGHPVEPGTVSIFGIQLLAIAFAAVVFWMHGWSGVAQVAQRPAGASAAALALVALLSAFQADDGLSGLTQAGFVWTGVAVFMAIQLFQPDPHEVLTSFVGGAIFQFIFGGYQFITQSSFASKWLGMALHTADQLGAFVVETDTGRWLRAYGTLSHPNVFGLYVGIGLLMCIGLAAFRGHGRHAKFYAFMPIIAAGLLFSMSRSAILAVAVGFIWMMVSAFGTEAAPHFRRVLIPSFIIIATTFGALGYLYSEPLGTRAAAEGRLEARSLVERTSQYSDAIGLFSRHLVWGVGIGQMPLALARETATERDWWRYDYVHNVPALVAVETGLVGLAVWAWFSVSLLWVMWRRLSHKTEAATGVTVYAAAFVALVVASMFDHFLWSSWFGQLLFWIVAGILHASYEAIGHRGHPGR